MAGFLFDMDGTLLDSIRVWHEAEELLLHSMKVELTKEQRDKVNALTLQEAAVFFHEQFGILESADDVVRKIIDYMLHFYRTAVEANPGAFEFVQALHESGAPLCVLSSSPQSFLQAGLARSGLKRFFDDDLIISAEELGLVKRDPRTFEYMCDKLGTAPEDTWLFDDSWYALATAHDMGVRCVGVFSTDSCGTHEELERYCERVVDSFTELDVRDFL